MSEVVSYLVGDFGEISVYLKIYFGMKKILYCELLEK